MPGGKLHQNITSTPLLSPPPPSHYCHKSTAINYIMVLPPIVIKTTDAATIAIHTRSKLHNPDKVITEITLSHGMGWDPTEGGAMGSVGVGCRHCHWYWNRKMGHIHDDHIILLIRSSRWGRKAELDGVVLPPPPLPPLLTELQNRRDIKWG